MMGVSESICKSVLPYVILYNLILSKGAVYRFLLISFACALSLAQPKIFGAHVKVIDRVVLLLVLSSQTKTSLQTTQPPRVVCQDLIQ